VSATQQLPGGGRTGGWTTATDLRAQLLRLWERDELLGAEFPLRLKLRAPTASALSEQFDAVRTWVNGLQQGSGYRLVLREVRHRVIGLNRLPAEAWVDALPDALRMIGKLREERALGGLRELTGQRQPALLPWIDRQPRRALALADDWPRLLDIIGWLQAHPRPGVYLRQVDAPGVHSKFIESQRGILSELLDLALPADALDPAFPGVAHFSSRYGFRDRPARVRLRFLDPRQDVWVRGGDGDYTLSAQAFASLQPDARRVFITENEINFLAFPQVADSVLVFGAGYGFDALGQAPWLQDRAVHYWGDIDTHGFAILDQLRAHVPHARSLLMDRATLLAHQSLWVTEPQPTQRELTRLNEEERRLYDDLRWRRLGDSAVRLEQEHIAFGLVVQTVSALAPPRPAS